MKLYNSAARIEIDFLDCEEIFFQLLEIRSAEAWLYLHGKFGYDDHLYVGLINFPLMHLVYIC